MKTKNKIVCLAMAATMAVGGFAPVQAVADEGSGYEALYYFSDYAGSSSYRNGVIASAAAEYQLATSDIHYYDYSNNADNFWGYINIEFLSDVPDNAFVIFERRTEENLDSTQVSNFFTNLREIFSSMKTQGCKIMLIYGTNEAKFNPESAPDTYNKFLEYIDIHINLDIFYNYMDSVFTYLEEEEGGEIADVTFILNENFVPSISASGKMSGVMGK